MNHLAVKNKVLGRANVAKAIFVLSISFLCAATAFAKDGVFEGVVNGGTISDTSTGVKIEGPGNVEFVGSCSTPAGFTVDIYANNALLRDNTNSVTLANGIYTLYGNGTLGCISSDLFGHFNAI